jgi:DNA-binding transcriptional LysR family regulator
MVAAGIGITIAPALLQAIHIEDIVWRELDLGQEAVSSILLVTNTRQSNVLRDQFIEIIKRNIEAPKAAGGAPRATRRSAG